MTSATVETLPEFSPIVLRDGFRYYAAGSSTHAVAGALKLTMPEAEALQALYVNTIRSKLATDRIAKRQAMRNKIGIAAGVLEAIATGQDPAFTGKDQNGPIEAAHLAFLRAMLPHRLRAASALLSAAKDFAHESLLDILVERQDDTAADNLGQTLYEFGGEFTADGGAEVHIFPQGRKAVG